MVSIASVTAENNFNDNSLSSSSLLSNENISKMSSSNITLLNSNDTNTVNSVLSTNQNSTSTEEKKVEKHEFVWKAISKWCRCKH